MTALSDLKAEYFDTAPPAPDRIGFTARLKAQATAGASALLLPMMRAIARDSIGGESLDDAWAVAQRLQTRGLAHTLGYWDTTQDTQADVTRIYVNAIARLGEASQDGYLSIKPPALRFDPAAAETLARTAARAGVRLHCDSHGANVADHTFGFLRRLLRHLPAELVSVTLPGRWARSLEDATRMAELGVAVRIVKGEWPDAPGLDRDLRQGFLELVDRAADLGLRNAVATHDVELAEQSLRRLAAEGAPAELEFIFGNQSNALIALADAQEVTARAYVPYGRGFAPSALKALRRNPRIALDMLGHMAGLRRPS